VLSCRNRPVFFDLGNWFKVHVYILKGKYMFSEC
jgi:hypothetical protein